MNQNIKQTLSLILLLSFAVSIVAVLPMTDAQTAPTKPTYAFISATPNPVGVGQETLLHIGITEATNDLLAMEADLTATVTKPDGTKRL